MAKRKLALLSGLIVAIGATSIIGFGVVSAASQPADSDSLVTKIAQKFNLNKDDVQKVFAEDKATHDADRKVALKTTLDQAVKDGKITADQETKLIAKLEELKNNRPANIKDMTQAERDAARVAMDKNRTDFEAWLKANNIPADLIPQPGMGQGHGMHKSAMMAPNM